MIKVVIFAVSLLVLRLGGFAQNGVFTFKAETTGTFVWGQDSPGGAISSTIQDPLTAEPILKLSYAGVAVSSRLGFERTGRGEAGDFLASTSIIVNNATSSLSVRYGGMSIEGRTGVPISVKAV